MVLIDKLEKALQIDGKNMDKQLQNNRSILIVPVQ
jgi:hypothetical protein